MTFNGWAINLNGVMLTRACESDQADWDESACTPAIVYDALNDVPEGLDPPDIRDEDLTYFQRDGEKHFQDWYEGKDFIAVGTLGPEGVGSGCGEDCGPVRQQLQDIVQAFKRSNYDTEMVVFTDCHQFDFTDEINVYPDGTFDVDADGWTGVDGAAVARVTSPVHSGAGALRITWGTDPVAYDDPATTGQTALGATLSGLTFGDRYLVSAWLYAAAGEPMPVLGCKDSFDDNAVYSDPIPADDTWHYVTVDYTVPDSGELIPFVVNGEATTSGDLAYVDDVEAMQYTNVNRALNGPFGLVGRPRGVKYKWVNREEQIVDFVARFRVTDQNIYVLDECGTAGYTNCVNIQPGSELFTTCFEDGSGDFEGERVMCFGGAGMCFSTPDEGSGSVEPEVVRVGGTERVYPTITLYSTLPSPVIENITTGEWVGYDGTIDNLPVTINTQDGTAFDAEGNSVTHLLRGSLYLSMDPGNYEWRMLVKGEGDDSGYAQLCWRDTVLNG